MEGGCPLDRRGFGPPPPVRTDPGTLQKGFSPSAFFLPVLCTPPGPEGGGSNLQPVLISNSGHTSDFVFLADSNLTKVEND